MLNSGMLKDSFVSRGDLTGFRVNEKHVENEHWQKAGPRQWFTDTRHGSRCHLSALTIFSDVTKHQALQVSLHFKVN